MNRAPQFAFALSADERERLAALSTLLGRSQAAVLKQCIADLWASLPKSVQRKLLAPKRARLTA